MAIELFRYAILITALSLVKAQGSYYSPFQISTRNAYSSGPFNPPNNAALQLLQAARRADTCSNSPGSVCMFLLLCLMAGGVADGPCSGSGLLSTCCILPSAQVPQPSRIWPTSVSSNVVQTSGTVKPQQYFQPSAIKPQFVMPSSVKPQQHAQTSGTIKPFLYSTTAAPKTTKSPGNFSFCGVTRAKPQSRIIGGNDAMYGEFPWQAHIKLNKQQCGGVLLNNYYVLTAAHCIYQVPLSEISIQLGVYDIQDHSRQDLAPQTFSVVEKKVHPKFKYQAAHPDRYDVALLKLDKAAKFQANVVPICLPPKDSNFQGRKGIITGWGKTDTGLSNRYGTRLLQKVDVPIISNELCERWHHEKGIDITISQEMLCAGYEKGQKDACVGDSGGPLMVVLRGRWTVAGLVSAGFGCAQSRQPGIYHRVPHTVEWLKENIKS